MCSVDKLLIKGIRSFSPENDHAIVFPKPLTLIVGRNGAGKTTVIECLKMATTGELPPSARAGQAFIHDPKVADVTEVKAQIKLRFRDVRKQPCVVTRSFQLTQKSGGKLEKKDLDQVIQTLDEKTGEKVSVSRKCADINATVPDMMGVSKAILENVVFVHQEDSNWPLGEAATLKKKFDEIFSATKYTKALEHINKLRKEQSATIKEYKLKVETLRVQCDHATKLKQRLDENAGKATRLGERMRTLQEKIDRANEALKARHDDLSAIRKIAEKKALLEAKRDVVVAECARRGASLKNELTDTLENLQSHRDAFGAKTAELRAELERHDAKCASLAACARELREKRERDLRAHGKLTAEAEAHGKRLSARASQLAALVAAYPDDIGPTPPALAAAAAAGAGAGELRDAPEAISAHATVRARARDLLDRLARAADELRAKHRAEDDAAAREMDEVSGKLAAAGESAKAREERRRACRRRAGDAAAEMSSFAVSDDAIEDLRRRVDDAEKLFDERRNANAASRVAMELEQKKEAIEAVEKTLSRLRAEQDRAAAAGESALKTRLKREELFSKEESMRSLLASRRERFADVFDGDARVPAPEYVKIELKRVVDARALAVETARETASAASNAASAAACALETAAANERRLAREAKDAEEKAEAEGDVLPAPATPATGNGERASASSRLDAYATAVKDNDAALSKAEEDLTVLKNLAKVFQSFSAAAGSTSCCPLCSAKFEDARKLETFRAMIESKVASIPEQTASGRAAVEASRERRAKLQALAPLVSAYERVTRTALPDARRALSDATAADAVAKRAASDASNAMETARESHASAVALAEDADTIARLSREARELRGVVESLERASGVASSQLQFVGGTRGAGAAVGGATQTQGGANPARVVSAIAADVEDAEASKAALEKERDVLQRKLSRTEQELLAIERDVRDLREEHVRVGAKADRKASLKREIEDLEREARELDAEEARVAAERAPTERRRDALVAARDAARATAAASERDADERVRTLQRDVDALAAADAPIDEYADSGKAAELTRCKEAADAAEAKMNAFEKELATETASAKIKRETIESKASIARDLDDNIAYLKGKEEEAKLTSEIDALRAKIQALGVDVNAVELTFRADQKSRDELREAYAESQGRVTTHQEAIDACKKELNDPQYKGVRKRLSKHVVELKTYEYVSQDLERYHSALDRALMAFHASKMSDINKVVKELWQRTYRGQDIDFIQIRSDDDTGNKGRSSYNYRVVMIVGDAELEMRGRCSAGQKVLACLIIRLALAETFCLNCGILALDEPTTNLDAPNADALARSLIDIMRSREDQENFQLIVITHDMHFAQVLGQREHADYYWRITKDDDQHSHIECENIYE